ncbi:MAG: AAA family ATPase [Candidatus Hodarchaeales archaeon]|jgi:MoxR-like ATPase
MNIQEAVETSNTILSEVNKHIIGKDKVLRHVMLSLLADGHILFEDYPGLAKTMICRSFASVLGCDFNRIQFTPDLLPQDLTGSEIYNQKLNDFEFKPGPLFADIILADEINRATPKTQSALLEAMGEYQVSIGGKTHQLVSSEKPFLVVATQNPLELEGTFALPEAQVDRFLAKIRIGYPSKADEAIILTNRINRKSKSFSLPQIISKSVFRKMQQVVETVSVSDEIKNYIVDIVDYTRKAPQVRVGASPRGSLDLMSLARANAVLNNRDYVIPHDVKELASLTLSHRIILDIGSFIAGGSSDEVISRILTKVKAPRKE